MSAILAEAIQLKKPFDILRNGALSTQPPDVLLQHGYTVAGLLRQLGGTHTLHPSPLELQFAMATNHAILAHDPLTKDVAGFVKAVPWIKTPGGPKMLASYEDIELVETGQAKPVCIEVGSLVVAQPFWNNHLGKHLAHKAVSHAKEGYPDLRSIAVVTNDNKASIKVFTGLGWDIIDRDQAIKMFDIDILDGWKPASTIFLYPN